MKNYTLSFQEDLSKNCSRTTLRISTSKLLTRREDFETRFIKDPCSTFLIVFNQEDDLNIIAQKGLSPGANQPYFFTLQKRGKDVLSLAEVYVYSRNFSQVLMLNMTDGTHLFKSKDVWLRRSDLKGITLRAPMVTIPVRSYLLDILKLFEEELNFTTNLTDVASYGSLSPDDLESWNGAIGELINHDVDFCPLDLKMIPERLKVVDAGFAFQSSGYKLLYKKDQYDSFSLFVMLQTFSTSTWVALALVEIILVISLTCLSKEGESFDKMLLKSVVAATKAIMGQSFDHKIFMGKYNATKMMLLFNMSLFSGFFFWCFSGVLISKLTVQKTIAPIHSLEGFKLDHPFKLMIQKSSSTHSMALAWANKSEENFAAFQYKVIFGNNEDMAQALRTDNNIGVYTSLANLLNFGHIDSTDLCMIEEGDIQEFVPHKITWMYPKNSFLKPLFDQFWKEIEEHGHIQKIRTTHYPYEGHCIEMNFMGVNLLFVLLIFMILVLGIIFALITFAFEVLKRYKANQTNLNLRDLAQQST